MSRIPQEIVEQIVQQADIAEVVGDYVSLKKKGQNLWAPCPFHNEKSPSFSVAPAKGIFKCFGCGKAGDAARRKAPSANPCNAISGRLKRSRVMPKVMKPAPFMVN